MYAALALVLAGPAPVATLARLRARRAPDRGVTAIVQRVVRQLVPVDIAPDVLLGPVDQRVDLPDPPLWVALDLGGASAVRSLLATDARDPCVDVLEGPLERGDLCLPAAVIAAGPR